MPLAYKIKRTMREQGISDEIISQFHFPSPKETTMDDMISIVNQMDMLLSKEQCLSIMERQGCQKTGKMAVTARAFGQEHAGKSLEEKITLYNESDVAYKVPTKLNPDGTLSVYWKVGEEGQYKCACSDVKKQKKQPADISLTYCGCCGGHLRETYRLALGVNLRIKEVVSSPINSAGKKHCEFLFEIID